MNNDAEFRFSPRPNRAAEIAWMPWGADAFERARAEDKPILLSISAVWCHWCHVMDETTYSDPAVIARINERYVPVRVDNDRRPDVNARYNMGGWPTTAFLAPDGTTMTGATYLPPQQLLRVLDELAEFYHANKAQIAERSAQLRGRHAAYRPAPPAELNASMISKLIEELARNYDEEYGGFGDAPKFPQPELLDMLLLEWRATGEERLYQMVATTILAMGRGGTYDHVEGGFFRYSTTRDWSVPHFEKMAEDHAGLLRVLAELTIAGRGKEVRPTLLSAIQYLRATLRDPATGLFAGSQDADEEYFALPLDERRQREAPFVDRTSYTNWTCALAGSWALAARALDDDRLRDEAMATLDAVHATLRDEGGLLYHVLVPGGAPTVRGLLGDQVAYLRALIDVHEVTGEPRFLERARDAARRMLERFEAPDGGLYDRSPDAGETVGRLDVSDRPIVDNGLAADSLLRLATLTDEAAFREAAERILCLYASTYAAAGSFAATYARALRRYLEPPASLRIVAAQPGDGEPFREAASRLPNPLLCLRTLGAAEAAALGLPAEPAPAAYLCRGVTCGPPVISPAEIRAAYEALPA